MGEVIQHTQTAEKMGTQELLKKAQELVKSGEAEYEEALKKYNESLTKFEEFKDSLHSGLISEFESLIENISQLNRQMQEKPNVSEEKAEFSMTERKILQMPDFKRASRAIKTILIFIAALLIIGAYSIYESGAFKSVNDPVEIFAKAIEYLGTLLNVDAKYTSAAGAAVLIGVPLLLAILYWLITSVILDRKNHAVAVNLYNEALEYKSYMDNRARDYLEKKAMFDEALEVLETLSLDLAKSSYEIRLITKFFGQEYENFSDVAKNIVEEAVKTRDEIRKICGVSMTHNPQEFNEALTETKEYANGLKRRFVD